GDLHDIGKNLVKMMLESKGIEVIDLGVDVTAEQFISTAKEKGAQIVSDSSGSGFLYHVFHFKHGGGQQGGAADHLRTVFGGGIQELFRRYVHAQVNHFDALGFQHHFHQILADVVQVTVYGTDHSDTGLFHCIRRKKGLQQTDPGVQRSGGNQHFGNVYLIVLEFFAHSVHTGQQTFVQNGGGGNTIVQCVLHQFFDDFDFPGLYHFVQFQKIIHKTLFPFRK
ncbi:MAG: cobalamin-dependent protein, partial [Clostridia bacterium]|nr:cobalamin-dependent protein [Clostridia bacterium]